MRKAIDDPDLKVGTGRREQGLALGAAMAALLFVVWIAGRGDTPTTDRPRRAAQAPTDASRAAEPAERREIEIQRKLERLMEEARSASPPATTVDRRSSSAASALAWKVQGDVVVDAEQKLMWTRGDFRTIVGRFAESWDEAMRYSTRN